MDNREYIINELEKPNIRNQAMIFFISPLTRKIEKRCGYFDEYMEAEYYINILSETYEKYNFPFLSYLNGAIYKNNKLDELLNLEG